MHKKGFSYAEAMVTMLIVAIIMVATTPILTQRKNVNRTRIWDWTATGQSAYFATGQQQRVYIGSNGPNETDAPDTARLIVTAPLMQNAGAAAIGTLPVFEAFYDQNNRIIVNELRAYGDIQHPENIFRGALGIGRSALSHLQTAQADNTAIGHNALENLVTGTGNTAIGAYALNQAEQGATGNTAIGNNTCANITTGSNNVCIGHIGPNNNTDYSVTIGTTRDNNPLLSYDDATGLLTIHAQINVLDNAGNSFTIIDSNISDSRLKNIKDLSTAGLNEINKIVVKNFTFKNDKENKPHVGVIAQELKKIFPNSVTKGEDGYYRITKDEIFYGMLNAIKELDKKFKKEDEKVTKLEQEVANLRAQNAQLIKKIEEIEKSLNK